MPLQTNPDGSAKFSCNNADCDNNLHCYRPKKNNWKLPTGSCQYCDDKSVDWERIKSRDLNDFSAMRDELKKEWIRNEFWTRQIDDQSVAKLATMTKARIKEELVKELAKCVKPAKPFMDGQRVPVDPQKMRGKPFSYAQHATASCCTKCVYYWWGFERNTEYTNEQIDFLANICFAYLHDRGVLPNN